MWYVYFLRLSNGSIYVGQSRDLKQRVAYHQASRVPSTKAHLPVTLAAYVAVGDENTAVALEAYFKSGSGKAVALKRFGLK